MPRPLIRVSPVEWLVMRYDEALPAAVIRKVHVTADGQCADKFGDVADIRDWLWIDRPMLLRCSWSSAR
jgi:hypothetical protein